MINNKIKKLIKIIFINCAICLLVQFMLPVDNLKNEIFWRYIVSFIFSYCIYKGSEEKNFLNPYILFAITPFSLMIYSQKVSKYFLVELRTQTWMLVVLNMIVFLLGMSLVLRISIKIGRYHFFAGNSYICNEKKADYSTHGILLFSIGQIPKIFLILGMALPGGQILSLCEYLGIAVEYKSGKKKNAYIMAIIYFILSILTTFNKTNFLLLSLVFIVCISSEIKNEREKRKLYIVILLVALAMIFIAFPLKDFLARGESLAGFADADKDYLANQFIGRIQWNGNIKLMMPYIYMTTNWTNLQFIMDTTTEFTNGLWFMKPLLGYLQIADGMKVYEMLVPYRPAFNTYSFVAVQYVDFGFWGSLFPSFIIGIFSGNVYKRYKKNPDSFNCACYALTAVAVFEMFFSNHFFTQSYPFTIFILSWICSKSIMKLRLPHLRKKVEK